MKFLKNIYCYVKQKYVAPHKYECNSWWYISWSNLSEWIGYFIGFKAQDLNILPERKRDNGSVSGLAPQISHNT